METNRVRSSRQSPYSGATPNKLLLFGLVGIPLLAIAFTGVAVGSDSATNQAGPKTVLNHTVITNDVGANETDGAISTGGASLLEIHSTADDDEFTYRFVVDGTVERTRVGQEGIAAEADDRIIENDDGTLTVIGSTGDGAGDAFLVDGTIQSPQIRGSTAYRILFTRNVTDQFRTVAERTFEIVSTGDEREFFYRFVVEGTVERTRLGPTGSAAEEDDEIVENENGTTVVAGSTGDGAGDAFVFRGKFVHFRKVSGSDDYRLRLDGEPMPQDHTLEIVPDGEDATYRVEVGGTIAPAAINGRTTDPDDDIQGNVATGNVYAGFSGDSYRYSGELNVTLVEGDARILVDGREVTLETIDLNVTVDGRNVTVENENDVAVTVTVESETGDDRTVEIASGESTTEVFEPGEYTLTAEAETGQDVQLNGERQLSIEVSVEDDTQLTTCQNITEPGVYEVATDLQTETSPQCLQVQSSDVTIDGNGYTIEGPGAPASDDDDSINAGIWIYNESNSRSEIDNVTVRNIRVLGWETGIKSGIFFTPRVSFSVEDSIISDNVYGTRFSEYDDAMFTNVTIEENRDGFYAVESGDTTLRSSVVRNNDRYGFQAGQASNVTVINTTVAGNGNNGVYITNTGEVRIENSIVSGNGRDGVFKHPAADVIIISSRIEHNNAEGINATDTDNELIIRNATILDNGEHGIFISNDDFGDRSHTTIEDVTISDNDNTELNALNGGVNATELQVGHSAELAFDNESIELEPISRESLPSLPSDVEPAGTGLSMTGVDDHVELTLQFDEDGSNNTEVQLWRYDSTEWTAVPNASVAEATDQIEGDVTADGIYVPVAVPAEEVIADLDVLTSRRR